MTELPRWSALAAVGAVIAAAHLALFPGIASIDSFYHLGHAAHYAASGLFDTAFPWGTQSIIGDLGADLWWGFHVLLVPFAALGSPAIGIRLTALLLTAALSASVFFVLRRHGVPGAGWWTALFLIAVPNVLYRYVMVRPHVLSLALELLLLSFLVRGRWWQVCLSAAAIVWLHLSLFWMAPGMVVAYALGRWAARPQRDAVDADPEVDLGTVGAVDAATDVAGGVRPLVAAGAVSMGTALGWLLRPHPLASAELAWIQIVRLFSEKATDQPLIFATELLPLPPMELARSAWLFLLAWLVALALRGWWREGMDAERRTLLATSALISLAFLVLTVFSARRALVELVAFGFLLIPLTWSFGLDTPVKTRLRWVAVGLLALHLPWAAWRHSLNTEFVAFPPRPLVDASEWLARNSAPGDVVFHGHWDNFGPLFAFNRVNHYLGGMDPIFQYSHDSGLYWEHFYLSGDLVVEYTCDAFPCYDGTATPTYEAIRDHFGARWVLVEPRRNPKLSAELLGNPGFAVALETPGEIVFRVLDAPSADPEGPVPQRP